MPRLEDPVDIGSVTVRNRLYRAPLLECAGNGPDAPAIIRRELEPAAESGVGLICQGSMLVTAQGGRSAPGLSRAHDAHFVHGLRVVTDAVHAHGARVFMQLGHGGVQTMETWHHGYRAAHPGLEQLAVSPLPGPLSALDVAGVLRFTPRVLTTEEVYGLARAFGRAAGYAAEAGYDGIHLAGANGSIIQQFLSPFFNRRRDEFGGATVEARCRFLEVVREEVRRHAGAHVPVMTKVPAETGAPFFVRRRLTLEDGVAVARHLEDVGFDAVVPVQVSVLRDASVARGAFPDRAWRDPRFQEGYREAFGGAARKRLLEALNRAWAQKYPAEAAWNAGFAARVKAKVDIPVLTEGGIRSRRVMDRVLSGGQADLVGMARPFYAEPRLAARILRGGGDGANGARGATRDAGPAARDVRAACESCNNCTIPQVTGAPGVCRTPGVMRRRGELQKRGAYERGGSERGETH